MSRDGLDTEGSARFACSFVRPFSEIWRWRHGVELDQIRLRRTECAGRSGEQGVDDAGLAYISLVVV